MLNYLMRPDDLTNTMNHKTKKTEISSRLLSFVFLVLLFSISSFGHDSGISAISLEIVNNKLVVHSSYARADFKEVFANNNIEDFRAFTKTAVTIELDGKVLAVLDDDFSLDNAHGVNLQHSFGEISGSQITITSFLPSRLTSNHTQILKLIRNDREISRKILKGNYQYTFDAVNLETRIGVGQFLALGIEHILFGFDHLLFLLALLLTVQSVRETAGIVTFFTIAHSITLSLAWLNIIQIPASFVEPIIALSIIYVGVENIFRSEHNRRWIVTYAFGLIHGFGFATALQGIGIVENSGVVLPLLSFNLGVEVGQIAFALLLLPIIWKLRKNEKFRSHIVPAVSILISIAGIYWLIERTLF